MSSKKLTGNKRVIRDCGIELYNCVQKWRSVTFDSHKTILDICQLKQKELADVEIASESLLDVESTSDDALSKLENLSSSLHSKVEKLEYIVKKVERVLSQLKAVSELSELQHSNLSIDSNVDDTPFQTWTMSFFCEVAYDIFIMHKEELKLKSSISKELCILLEMSALTFFEACWKYEPNIDKDKLNMLLSGIIFQLNLFSQLQ